MNIYAITSLMALIANFGIGLFVYFNNPKNIINKLCGLTFLSISLWVTGCLMESSISDRSYALIWDKVLYTGLSFLPAFSTHFVNKVTNTKRKWIISCSYCLSTVFLIFNLSPLRVYFISDVIKKYPFRFIGIPEIGWFIFVLYLSASSSYWILTTFFAFKKSKGNKRNQLKYFFIAYIIGSFTCVMYLLLLINIRTPPVDNFTGMLFGAMIAYAVVRYRLMDITVAITRTAIFSFVFTLVLGIPFAVAFGLQGFLTQVFGLVWWVVPLIISVFFGAAGPYVYLYIQHRAEDRLLQDQRQYQETLRRASMGMGRIKDLRRLLNLIVHIVTKAVRIDNCEVYLYDEGAEQFSFRASKKLGVNITETRGFSFNSAIVKHLINTKEPIVYEEVKHQNQDRQDKDLTEIEEIMERTEAAVAIPSLIDNRLMAIFMLGEKKSHKLYSQDDLAVFSILSNQAALAIENALFYEDMQKKHEQLFKAEKMATIGTMADGLSHQLNNRFHAMGFIAGDAVDTIKMGEPEKLPEDDRALLQEVESALNRIETNVKQGGEVVEGLLKYTRKGEIGFAEVDFEKLFDAALDMVKYKIKLKDIDVERNFKDNLPPIRGNFTQLQEAFFNLIDNAYDAMMQRKVELNEDDYNGCLKITAKENDENLEILLLDNGIGVKEEDLRKLFTPFFTTKLSSKKGTGLGLYVIRQIIEENHGGVVQFGSIYKNGSQIRIVLPCWS